MTFVLVMLAGPALFGISGSHRWSSRKKQPSLARSAPRPAVSAGVAASGVLAAVAVAFLAVVQGGQRRNDGVMAG
ncbi:MAG: hypothetical protein HC897_10310 [Thermoanaerobaculia bacterium]|nr:hypothetical protein [Thermoanaerobaculia bacterium]